MVRIGIIDDERAAREKLREEIARFEAQYGTEFDVREFDCAAAYLSEEDSAFDILYLDIDMPQMTGMELAEKIREEDADVILIFCTNLQQFAINGYHVSALGFLVKPVQWYSFHMYLDRALKAVEMRTNRAGAAQARSVVIKDGARSHIVDVEDIKYVEVQRHYLLYHITGRGAGGEAVIQTRGSLQDAANQLLPYGFVRCNASFLVNLSSITAVSRMDVYIGQDILRIGRTYKDSFTKEFSRYLAKKGWESPCSS